jgi:hypothetical protein
MQENFFIVGKNFRRARSHEKYSPQVSKRVSPIGAAASKNPTTACEHLTHSIVAGKISPPSNDQREVSSLGSLV